MKKWIEIEDKDGDMFYIIAEDVIGIAPSLMKEHCNITLRNVGKWGTMPIGSREFKALLDSCLDHPCETTDTPQPATAKPPKSSTPPLTGSRRTGRRHQ